LAYFSQHASEGLDPSLSVMETVLNRADMTTTEARNYLARYLFMGDDVFKTVNMLSGGEKNKLALACMILEPCNLLILDEPTNHLDIASCEVLTDMLSHYKGTLLLVSHDRYLLNAVTTRTFALAGDGSYDVFDGNYSGWRETVREPPRPVPARPPAPAPSRGTPAATTRPHAGAAPAPMNARELSKARAKAREAAERTEADVAGIEQRIAEVESALASPSGSSARDMVGLAAEHTRLQDDLLTALTAWERATALQEELGA
ncbi:MAG: ATP-binding cassette domain-containing protein, partial [Capsulimonadaceae bacterium]